MADIAIKVENVSKNFILPHERTHSIKSAFTGLFRPKQSGSEVQHALQDISFEVKKGEFFGIVGRNGSGKSTLLKIIAEIYQPSTGSVQRDGKIVPFIELGVGFNPELTGKENVYLNGAMFGFSYKEVEAMYDDIVSFAELERFMDQKLKNYSSGMQVRLAFSMAIRANADILLIDEVLAVGDAAFQRKCLDYFRKLKKEKRTVIFVSHDMDSVRQFCDRAILVEKSRIIDEGNADKVSEHYSRLFLESAASAQSVATGDEEKNRWGSREATFSGLDLSSHAVTNKEEFIEFGGVINFKSTIADAVIGFKISDGAGRLITGTNSTLLRIHTGTHEAGTQLPFKWRVPNIFSNGDYEISLALKEETGSDLDVWNGALKFSVTKPSKTPYIVTPDLHLSLEHK